MEKNKQATKRTTSDENVTQYETPTTSRVATTATTSPLASQVMSKLLEQLPSKPNPSPTTSADKTDNRETIYFSGADLQHEAARIKTFEKWPLSFLTAEQLARNGFYYLGRGDEVRCAFCKVEIMRWEIGDDPATDHRRWAPQCPFLKKHANLSTVPQETNTSAGRDECGVRAPQTTSPVRMPGPVHPQYASEAARLNSFKDWPRCMRQKPEDLAEAGFYYTGQGDKTKCFYCDGGLKDWEDDDIPWEQHARWFNRCAYVQLVKGKEYVQNVISNACEIRAPTEETKQSTPATSPKSATVEEETPIDDSKVCKICYVEERNVVFIPCGHVVACAKCALSTNKCPMCRRTFQNAVRLYFS